MPTLPTQLLVAWSGADVKSVRALLFASRLPVLAARLAGEDLICPRDTGAATPFALALTLATGISPADHGVLAPVQPAPDGRSWQPSALPAAPLWDRLAHAGIHSSIIGWPGTRGAPSRPALTVISDLDLVAADTALRPLPPLSDTLPADTFRITPAELDPALLGFFIPRADLPANPATDPVVRELSRHLARIYSAHNTAVANLVSPTPPAFLAVHYELPVLPAAALQRHPRLREASLRLLDLLLGDLLRHAPHAALTLAGLSSAGSFVVGRDTTSELTAIAPRLLAAFDLSPNSIAPPAPTARFNARPIIERYHAIGLTSADTLKDPPSASALLDHTSARGRLLLSANRAADALPLLAPLFFQQPENPAAALPLYECLHALGLRDEAREPADALREHTPSFPESRLIEAGLVLRNLRDPSRALPLIESLLAHPRLAPRAAALQREALLHLRRFNEVRPMLEAAVANSSATADTHAGLAYACFQLDELAPAQTAAETALALGSARPQPARILQHLADRRAGRRTAPDIPAWDDLLAHASARTAHRETYAILRRDWLASRATRRAAQAPVFFLTGTPAPPTDAQWVVVTGAPRSGRALLLRMLSLGGFPVLTDGLPPADVHNPHGYFDWSPLAQLRAAPRLIDDAANHAVKLPPHALRHLPRDRRYRVLFVTRDPAEIARSEATVRNLPPAPPAAVADLASQLEHHLAAARADPNFDVLEIPYHELHQQPAAWAARLADLLGTDRLRRVESMPAAVNPILPRHGR